MRRIVAVSLLVSMLGLSTVGCFGFASTPDESQIDTLPVEQSEMPPPTAPSPPEAMRITDISERCEALFIPATLQALFSRAPLTVAGREAGVGVDPSGVCDLSFDDGSTATVVAYQYAEPEQAVTAFELQRAQDEQDGVVMTPASNVGAAAYIYQMDDVQVLNTFAADFFVQVRYASAVPMGQPQLATFATFALQTIQVDPSPAAAEQDGPQGSIFIEPSNPSDDETSGADPSDPDAVCGRLASVAEIEGLLGGTVADTRAYTDAEKNIDNVLCEARFAGSGPYIVQIEFHEDDDDAERAYRSMLTANEANYSVNIVEQVGEEAYALRDGGTLTIYTYEETYYVTVSFQSSQATQSNLRDVSLLTMNRLLSPEEAPPTVEAEAEASTPPTLEPTAVVEDDQPAPSVPLVPSIVINNGNVVCNNLSDPATIANIFGKPVVRVSFNDVEDAQYGPRLICTVSFQDSSTININLRQYEASDGALAAYQSIYGRPAGASDVESLGQDSFAVIEGSGVGVYLYEGVYYVQVRHQDNSGVAATLQQMTDYARDVVGRLP